MQTVLAQGGRNTHSEKFYIGVDVGTGSARVALVDHGGNIIATKSEPIRTFRSPADSNIFEQSTPDIWRAISICTKDVIKQSDVKPEQIKGLGFDATCSLAVSDLQGEPITVTVGPDLGKHGDRNVILWADHRAHAEAKLINSSGSDVLKYVGGTMSLEMEIPKTLWLKNNMPPDLFSQCQFFDLPDFLTYKATSDRSRSCCSLVCKCSYVPPPAGSGWDDEFLTKIGLRELVDEGYLRLGGFPGKDGSTIMTAGLPVARGLSKSAAADLGLLEGTPVGSSVIDAYAGWIGTVAARYTSGKDDKELSAPIPLSGSRHRLAAVAGTSTCHVIHNPDGIFVPGVWGPYQNAVFPGWWMNEGGQSSTGQLIDFVITTHPAYPELREISQKTGKNVHILLEEKLEELRKEAAEKKAAKLGKKAGDIEFGLTELTKDLHFYPDFHGNRSPLADPEMCGSIVGLILDSSLSDLALRFNVTLEAIALQTRHIVDEMNARGYDIQGIFMSGGQAGNMALMTLFANVCNIPVILPHAYGAAVVIGSAMLGRYAAEVNEQTGGKLLSTQEEVERVSNENKERLWDIMVEMTRPGVQIVPCATMREKKLLEAKYKIFRETIDIQQRWRKEMTEAAED